jgi:hypothetical protein
MRACRYEAKEGKARTMSMLGLSRLTRVVPEVKEGLSRVGVARSYQRREMKVEGWCQGQVSQDGR